MLENPINGHTDLDKNKISHFKLDDLIVVITDILVIMRLWERKSRKISLLNLTITSTSPAIRRKSLEAKLWGKQPRPDEALRIHRSTRGSQVADAQGKLAEPYRALRTLRSTRGSQVAKSWVKRPGLDGVRRTHRSRRRRFLLARVVNELVPNLLTGVNDEKKMCVTL